METTTRSGKVDFSIKSLPNKQTTNFEDGLVHRLSLVLIDTVLLLGIYLGSIAIRYPKTFTNYLFWDVICILVLTTLVPLGLIGGHSKNTDLQSLRFMSEHIIVSAFSFLLATFCIYVISAFNVMMSPARLNISLTLILFPLFSLLFRRHMAARMNFTKRFKSIYILGTGNVAQDFYRLLKQNKWQHTLRFFALNSNSTDHLISDDPKSPLLGGDIFAELAKEQEAVSTIVLAEDTSLIPNEIMQKLVSVHFSNVNVQTLDTFFAREWKMVPTGHVSLAWAFEKGFRLNSPSYERFKRLTDIFLSLIVLLIFSPAVLMIPLLIRVESKGPAIFRQTRVGRYGRTFMLYKFRTMRPEKNHNKHTTQNNDTRITCLGQLLRKSRMDELPQLWNVIKGDMSLIGPRAEWNKCVEEYEEKIPFYHFRHTVKPGITGWAQVNYPYGENEVDAEEKLKYDLYYIRHFSFGLDLSICLKTLYVMLFAKGK